MSLSFLFLLDWTGGLFSIYSHWSSKNPSDASRDIPEDGHSSQQLCRDLRAEGWRPAPGELSQLELTHGSAGTSLGQGRQPDPPGRGEAKGI